MKRINSSVGLVNAFIPLWFAMEKKTVKMLPTKGCAERLSFSVIPTCFSARLGAAFQSLGSVMGNLTAPMVLMNIKSVVSHNNF